MPRPEDDLALRPIDPIGAAEVPKAGQREMTLFKDGQENAKASLTLWGVLTAVATALTVVLAPEGYLAYGLFLSLAMAFGSTAAVKFWKLSRAKPWRSLPDGATETTALLEDALCKSIRQWNGEAARWNGKLAALDADVLAWRRTSEDRGREDGWSEASHAMEGEALLARGRALMLEKHGLIARRRRIRRAIGQLGSAVRRGEQESQDPDPQG